ncbi:MAG: AraC family transcriptional regulator [Ferruginibacter sp.]
MLNKERKAVETLAFHRPDDTKLLFEIIDLSRPGNKIPATPHRHDFYEIAVILKGKTTQLVDFKTYKANSKEVLIIPKGSIHQGAFKEKLEGFLILFTSDFFTKEQYDFLSQLELFNASYNSNRIKFNRGGWDEVTSFFNALKQEYFTPAKTADKNILRFLLLAFSAKLNALAENNFQAKPVSSSIVKPFFELLEKNFKQQHLVNFYCSQLNITSKKLTQALAGSTGKTSLHIINDRILLEAKRELSFSKKTIKEIAFDLGFDDPLYFSKFFKKHTSLPPQDFRKGFAEISM